MHLALDARTLAAMPLAKALGQTVIVENRSGGGGLIGTRQAIAAQADGHTLLMAANALAANVSAAIGANIAYGL